MGLWQQIKDWFRRRLKTHNAEGSSAQPMISSYPPEVEILFQEHEQLQAERIRLRKEIELVDTRFTQGAIEASERDRVYRARLARAGGISLRQMEIRKQLAEMGYTIPKEAGDA